jgi:ATP-dependent DNA helicase RecG
VDALLRRSDIDRYDDRVYIQTNLIDTFDLLMAFVEKHLDDKFHLEGDIRISLRDNIFREVISNLIVHREYRNAMHTIFTIFKDRVEVVNANNPWILGEISLKHFSPHPKNPIIAKFFMQLGRFDELGSGIINVNKYQNLFVPGTVPVFIEEVTSFRTIIPLGISEGTYEGTSGGINEGIKSLLVFIKANQGCRVNVISTEMAVPEKTVERWIAALRKQAKIEFRGSKKTGGYYIIQT